MGLEKLKDILGQLGLKFRFESATVDVLEELERRIYVLEQDNKKNVAAIRSNATRYSELLMIMKSRKHDNT